VPQQLDGRERVPSSLLVEGLAKDLTQAVGFSVQESLHELPPLDLSQIYLDVPELALEFVDDRFEWMSFPIPS